MVVSPIVRQLLPRRLLTAAASRSAPRLLSTQAVLEKPPRLDAPLEGIISQFRTSLNRTRASGEKSKALVDDVGMLQRFRVQRVLLVCSDYDSYTFEEDGLLTEIVDQWYSEHSLSKPPRIDRASTPESGIALFREQGDYDMVITLSRMAATSNLVPEILRLQPATPIALLALTPSELTASNPMVDESLRLNVNKRLYWETHHEVLPTATGSSELTSGTKRMSNLDYTQSWIWPFMWQGSSSLFTAMFKAVEDRLNVQNDAEYGVGTLLVVEDSVKFYSSYLPMLYSELWRQNNSITKETMNTRERILRLHSRPKVLFCTNYEEALDVYDRYRDSMFGVISDLSFPKAGVHNPTAGLQLIAHMKEMTPELPVLMQTSQAEESEYAAAAQALGAKYVWKHSPNLLQSLHTFMIDDCLFGPLTFRDAETGQPLGQVSSVAEMMETWRDLPLSSVAMHARQSHLSRWFFARAEFQLAKRFRASQYPMDFIDENGKERADWLRSWILREVRTHRNKLASTVENVHSADASTPITRLGSGSMGGKGRGFRFLHSLSDRFDMRSVISDVELVVPRCFILATSVFDEFLETNALLLPALNAQSDAEVRALFDAAPLPAEAISSLRIYLERLDGPLAVRSSSLFEDSFMQPFAGVYESHMLPNARSAPLEERLEQLMSAVKLVYASTYSQGARTYAESMQNRSEEEKMAVILQPIVGSADADNRYFYPNLAGVANSVDFYPRPGTSRLHGTCSIGLDLGSSVVDGETSVTFSLGDPSRLSGPDPATMPVTAIDLSMAGRLDAADPEASSCVVTLDSAASDALTIVPKPSDMQMAPQAAQTVPLTSDVHGEKVVFNKAYGKVQQPASEAAAASSAAAPAPVSLQQILTSETQIAKALSFVLRLGAAGLGCPVEVEFALRGRQTADEPHQLHLLQIRPQAQVHQSRGNHFQFLPSAEYAAVASRRALGHGRFEGITDVVYVSPERFDTARTAEIAAEIAAVNASISNAGRKYMLMAPGRWGSADSAKGIPVDWSDISASAVIVETVLDATVPLSQGSHFFQNIISFGLGYLTVDPHAPSATEVADYAYWETLPSVEHASTSHVRHVRLDAPLEIVVDGQSSHGVVMKPGKAFDVYVSQVDAFMALAQEQSSSQS